MSVCVFPAVYLGWYSHGLCVPVPSHLVLSVLPKTSSREQHLAATWLPQQGPGQDKTFSLMADFNQFSSLPFSFISFVTSSVLSYLLVLSSSKIHITARILHVRAHSHTPMPLCLRLWGSVLALCGLICSLPATELPLLSLVPGHTQTHTTSNTDNTHTYTCPTGQLAFVYISVPFCTKTQHTAL